MDDRALKSHRHHDYIDPEIIQTAPSHDLGSNRAGIVPELGNPLPPVDGGKDAWCFLAAIFLFEAVIWGLQAYMIQLVSRSQLTSSRPYTFGIFQEYYSTLPLFSGSSAVAAIGSTALGFMYLPAPLLSLALQRWHQYSRLCMVAGLTVVVISLIAASFCSTVPALIGTQGVLFAIGGA